MRITGTVPLTPAEQLAATIADMRREIDDLQRAAAAPPIGAARGIVAGSLKVGTASTWTDATATLADITASVGDAPSFTGVLSTARRYRFVFRSAPSGTNAADVIVLQLSEGGTLRELQGWMVNNQPTGQYQTELVPASGASVTYKMRGRKSTGSPGTVSMTASATRPMVFYIEDIGPA
jgi:hypothetical protein